MNADRPERPFGQSQALPKSTDLLVVGGGIMGLWAALKAARLGLKVTLIEKSTIGSGASGGLIGALMAHMPDKWNPKKDFQFRSLIAIEHEIGRIEEETGLKTGYRRSGRLIPLPKPHLRDIALRHQQDALQNWSAGDRQFHWNVEDFDPLRHGVDSSFCASGVVMDTLAARVSPRSYVNVMHHAVQRQENVLFFEDTALQSVDAAHSIAHLSNGEAISFGHMIIAAGYEAFPLLKTALEATDSADLGQGVKGQAALLKGHIDPASPVVFLNGLYIIPHEDGTIAIGSTSEMSYDEPFTTDGELDKLLQKARTVMPALENAELIERWAGLRPRAIGREPMIGAVPSAANIIALAGGFKVSFGIAHKLADAALTFIDGGKPDVPEEFLLSHHLSVAKQ